MRNFLMIFSAFLLYTCVGSNNSNEHNLWIDFKMNNKGLDYTITEIVQGTIVSNGALCNMKVESMKGGSKSFLGYVYGGFHGDEFKERVTVNCHTSKQYFSINEILEWSTKKVGDKHVYIAPQICSK